MYVFQRKMCQVEIEKTDLERGQVQLEKDRAALMKTLDKVGWQVAQIGSTDVDKSLASPLFSPRPWSTMAPSSALISTLLCPCPIYPLSTHQWVTGHDP